MAAAPDDLCTVAELKAWLPNQGNNDDVTLQSLISNASLHVLQYIDRPHILSSVLGAQETVRLWSVEVAVTAGPVGGLVSVAAGVVTDNDVAAERFPCRSKAWTL